MVPVKLSTQALPQQFHRREMLPLILDSTVAIQGMSKYLRPSRMNFCTNSNTGFHRIRLRRMFKVGNSTYGISRCFLAEVFLLHWLLWNPGFMAASIDGAAAIVDGP